MKRHQERTRAAIYARVSSERQDVANSIDAQISHAQEFAQRQDWIVTNIYKDEAESGLISDRPEFLNMMPDGTGHGRPFDVVLVWKLSRFSRSRLDNALYKSRLLKNGVRVVSINEPNDGTPTGDLLEGIIESVDAFYSANLGQDVRRGQRQLASRGFYMGNVPPYGFKIIKKSDGDKERSKLDLDPDTYQVDRRIWDMRLNDVSTLNIARTLNQEGIPSPKGTEWRKGMIHKVLTNEHYAGTIAWGLDNKSGDPPVRAPNSHPGIVTQEEFDLVRKKLAADAPTMTNPRQTGSPYLLTGLIKCRQCGGTMIARPAKGGKYVYLTCDSRIQHGVETCDTPALNVNRIDPLVLDAILQDILTEENIRSLITQIRKELGDVHKEQKDNLKGIEKRLAEVDQRQNRIILAYETGKMSLEKYSERMDDLENMQQQLEQAKASANLTMDDRSTILENPDAVVAYAKELTEFLRLGGIGKAKPFLRRFVKHIWIEPGRGIIEYKIPLPDGSIHAGKTKRELALTEPVRSLVHPAQPDNCFWRDARSEGRASRRDAASRWVQGLPADLPPSTMYTPPVQKLLSSLARKSISLATSSGLP